MKTTSPLSAAVLALLVSASVSAQPPWAGGGFGDRQDLDRRVQRMAERLDLSAEQREQIRSILDVQRERSRDASAAVRQQIDAVLTEEQRALRDQGIDRRIGRRVARIADHLDLTAEQESELRTAISGARSSSDWDREAMRERLSSVLTAEQLSALEEMRGVRGRGFRGCRMR